MMDCGDRPALDPYVLTRELSAAGAFWKPGFAIEPPMRFLAMHMGEQTSHVAYRFPRLEGDLSWQAFRVAVDLASTVRHKHVLRIDKCVRDAAGVPWVITPLAGDVDGVRPLTRLLKEKNGQLAPMEAERALVQLFEALMAAHVSPALPRQGQIGMENVLVDRYGSVCVELYALGGLLAEVYGGERTPRADDPRAEQDEVRSVVEIGYQLITGLRAETPRIPAGRLVKGLDERWNAWLEAGLGENAQGAGFASAKEAMERLPGNQPEACKATGVGSVGRFVKRLGEMKW